MQIIVLWSNRKLEDIHFTTIIIQSTIPQLYLSTTAWLPTRREMWSYSEFFWSIFSQIVNIKYLSVFSPTTGKYGLE